MSDNRIQCPSCGADLKSGIKKCDFCGSKFKKVVKTGDKIDISTMACPFCKFEFKTLENHCRKCGERIIFNCNKCNYELFIRSVFCQDCGTDISDFSQYLISKDYTGIASFAESLIDINIESSLSVFKEAYISKSFDRKDKDAIPFLLKYAQALHIKYTKLLKTRSASLLGSTNAEKEKLIKIILDSKVKQSVKNEAENLLIKRDIEEKKGGCFIVTATMGSHNHLVVINMQDFRDKYLLNFYWGKFIIKIYNKIGPILARLISKNIYLRKFCYKVIVNPSHRLSKYIL